MVNDRETRQTGATWMAATGAFLLVAAAAVFVAVRWNEIPEILKLALLGALSGGAIIAGRTLRSTLPATAKVLVHLGVFLVPVVGAATTLRLDAPWSVVLLIDSLIAVVSFATFAVLERSVVLRWATNAAVVAAAFGLAGVAHVPAGVTLGVVALALVIARRFERDAISLAVSAAVLPVVGAAFVPFVRLGEITNTLQLTGPTPWPYFAVAGVFSAVSLTWLAHRRQQIVLLAPALVAVIAHALEIAWVVEPSGAQYVLSVAAIYLLVELVALATKSDPFFAPISKYTAITVEIGLLPLAFISALMILLFSRFFPTDMGELVIAGEGFSRSTGAALAMGALGVAVARLRSGDVLTDTAANVLVPLFTVAASVCLGYWFDALWVTAIVAALVAGVGFLPRSAALALWAVPAALWFATFEGAALGAAAIVTSAFLLVVVYAHRGRGVAVIFDTVVAAAVALVPFAVFDTTAVAVGYTVAITVAAFGFEQLRPAIAWILRSSAVGTAVVSVITVWAVDGPLHACVVAGVLAVVAGVDAFRRHDEWWVIVGGVAATVAIGIGLTATTLTPAAIGVALVTIGTCAALLTAIPHRVLQFAAAAMALGSVSIGITLSMLEPDALAVTTIIVGAGTVGLAVLHRVGALVFVGSGFVLAGLLSLFALRDVTIVEAYVTPVAVALGALGYWGRRSGRGLNSWAAYGPAIALVLAASIVERIVGGSGWHAVFAGVVAVSAVGIGAYRRLAAPIFLGTAAIVVLTVRETLDVTAGVPTWGWLALGGVVLLGGGIVLERSNTGPVEAGRRLVDVVNERYG